MLDDLTIVITTYKRYTYLKRLLKFYDTYKLKSKIFILDSTPYLPDDEELQELLCNQNVKWKRYNSNIFVVKKISLGISEIETKFSVLCADDDFLIPPSLKESISFLKSNLDYSSVQGLHFAHTSFENIPKYKFSIAPRCVGGCSASEENILSRINSYLSGTTRFYPVYAVHHTNTLKKIWKETDNYVYDWGLSEVFPACLSLIIGKMKILPIFYISREPNTSNSFNCSRYKEMFSEDKLEKAINGLAYNLSEYNGYSLQINTKNIKNLFNTYIEKSIKNWEKMSSKENLLKIMFRKIRYFIRFRTRVRVLFYKGCHPAVYPKFYDDYLILSETIQKTKTSISELNTPRKEYVKSI